MIEVKNVGEVCTTIDKWVAEVESIVTKFCRGMSVQIFENVLGNSVQYSGDFAANWKYQLNAVTPEFAAGVIPEFRQDGNQVTWVQGKSGDKSPFFSRFRPMDERGLTHLAKAYALRANRGKDSGFKLGDTIYIHNSATHDAAYAVLIEEGLINFRIKGSDRPLGRAVDSAMGTAAGGAGRVTAESVVFEDGYKAITARTQLDSLRRRPGRDLGA